MSEKLSYYTIVPWREIKKTYIWSDSPSIVSYDEDTITISPWKDVRTDEFYHITYHRKKQALIDKLLKIYERDLEAAQKNLNEFKKQYL